jgi:hypothetical protein
LAVVSVGSAVGDPLATSDGTVWVHRTGVGQICELPKGADHVSCPVSAPKGHAGALTMIGDRLEFVDLFTDEMHAVEHNVLGPGVPLGVPVSPETRPATQDLAGRTVLLDPGRHVLLFADSPHATAVTVPLPGGDYDGPMSNGSTVVVVDRQSGTVLTYGPDGKPQDAKPIGHDGGQQPRLSHGEDNRLYVENPNGTHVLVVGSNGKVQDVPVTPKPVARTTTSAGSTSPSESRPTGSTDPTAPPSGTGEPVAPPTTRKPPVALPASAPGAPTTVSATAGDSSATVTWGPAADNRSAITSYLVSYQASTGVTGSVRMSGAARQVAVTGLTNGVRYVFTVTATNQVGTGPGVATASVIPFAVAAAPAVTATPQSGGATVSWAAPDLRGGTLVDYLVSATGQADQSVTTTSTSYTGFAPGQTVTFTVRAMTRTADGRSLAGAPGSYSLTMPQPKIVISHGAFTTSSNCKAPDCANVDAAMTGFAPNTQYAIKLVSDSNSNVQTEFFTTDANGAQEYDQLDYDSRGQTVWIVVNGIKSNTIAWP